MSTQQDRTGGSLLLGTTKYLYTGYFVGGCVVAFLVTHIVDMAWGEGHDQATSLMGGAAGILAVVWAWRNQKLRATALETIDELAAVTWPSKQETYTATVVVLITSIVSALIIFGLDRFWNWVTDQIYLS